MRHDELLAKIDYEIDLELRGMDAESWHAGARALRAVVKLHKQDFNRSVEGWCEVCQDYYFYPCPTIRAIIKELK